MLTPNNIFLRLMSSKDISIIFEWENNPDNWEFSDTKKPFTEEEISDFVNSTQSIYLNNQLRLMISLVDKDVPIGCIDLFELDTLTKSSGVGILIGGEQYKNKGFAKNALGLLISYAKKELMLNQLFCNISLHNTRSIRLFEGCGFLFKEERVLFEQKVNYYQLKL